MVRVCDRCKREQGLITVIEIMGNDYDLCDDCIKGLVNYIKVGTKKGMFSSLGKLIE